MPDLGRDSLKHDQHPNTTQLEPAKHLLRDAVSRGSNRLDRERR